MRKIVVIDGHPDPDRSHLIHALADRYADATTLAGHDVRRVNVAELDFAILRSPSDFVHGTAPAALAPVQRDIKWGDHLAFFFPLWHGMLPALLKAFIEQTFRPGYAMETNPNGFPKPLLGGRSVRIVVTMGMPALLYRIVFGAHGVKAFERSVLGLGGMRPIHTTLLGGLGEDATAKARAWLDKMELLALRDTKPQAFGLARIKRSGVLRRAGLR